MHQCLESSSVAQSMCVLAKDLSSVSSNPYSGSLSSITPILRDLIPSFLQPTEHTCNAGAEKQTKHSHTKYDKDFKGHIVGWEGKESEPGEFGRQENMMKTHKTKKSQQK